MDPLTLALKLANTIAEIILEAMRGQPPDVKAQLWQFYLEDVKAWREFWGRFLPKATP